MYTTMYTLLPNSSDAPGSPVLTSRDSEKILRNFASKDLCPNEDAMKQAVAVAQRVFKHLQKQDSYYVNRMKFGGATSQSTMIPSFSFDMIVYITEINPKTKAKTNLPGIHFKILKEFQFKLTYLKEVKDFNISDIQVVNSALSFKMNGFMFNIYPAQNYVEPKKRILPEAKFIQNQTMKTIAQFETWFLALPPTSPTIVLMVGAYESGLCEFRANFLESQSTETHELVRVCKFWNNSLTIEEIIKGREYIISLIAVAAGRATGGKSIIQAFHFFLCQIYNFEQLDIEFEPIDSLSRPTHFGTHQKPRIHDPSNPHINLVDKIPKLARDLFKCFAGETLRRLGEFESKRVEFSLEKLFIPQPLKIKLYNMALPKIKRVLVSITNEELEKMPGMTFKEPRSEETIFTLFPFKYLGDRINTLVTIEAASWGDSDDFQNIIRASIEKCIPVKGKSIIRKVRRSLAAAVGRRSLFEHADGYVTYSIPYWVGENRTVVLVSLKI